MNALNLAALKRQLTTLSDEYSGLSPQVAAQIAADALEVIKAIPAPTESDREVLGDLIEYTGTDWEARMRDGLPTRPLADEHADAILAAGFRRTSAPKTQGGEVREALAQMIERASTMAFFDGTRGPRDLAFAQADAILARYNLVPTSPAVQS